MVDDEDKVEEEDAEPTVGADDPSSAPVFDHMFRAGAAGD